MLATRACTEVQTADIPLRHCVGVPGRGAASAPAAAPGRDGELLALGQAPLGRDPEHAAVGGAAATETRQGRIRVAEPAADRGVAGVELRPYRQARQPGPGPRARRALALAVHAEDPLARPTARVACDRALQRCERIL